MTQDAYNFWSIILQAFSALISFAVAIIVYHYTRATKRLRKATDDQVNLLREQGRAASTPFIIPSFNSWSLGGTQFTKAPISAVKGFLNVSLTIATPSPAIDIHAIFKEDDQYYYSVTILDAIPPNNPTVTERVELRVPLPPTALKAAIERDFGRCQRPCSLRFFALAMTICLSCSETPRPNHF